MEVLAKFSPTGKLVIITVYVACTEGTNRWSVICAEQKGYTSAE